MKGYVPKMLGTCESGRKGGQVRLKAHRHRRHLRLDSNAHHGESGGNISLNVTSRKRAASSGSARRTPPTFDVLMCSRTISPPRTRSRRKAATRSGSRIPTRYSDQ